MGLTSSIFHISHFKFQSVSVSKRFGTYSTYGTYSTSGTYSTYGTYSTSGTCSTHFSFGTYSPFFSYPYGFLLCQRQVSAHISSMPRSAFQPSSFSARAGSAQHSATSPGRRGQIL